MSIKKKLQGKVLDLKQKRVTRAYNKHGLTDEILDKQVAINTKRHDLNIRECKEGEYRQ